MYMCDLIPQFTKIWVYHPALDEALSKWNQLPKAFETPSQVKIPRHYSSQSTSHTLYELHGFSDASEKAYTAVVYLRASYEHEENTEVSFVASKASVAPMKKQSIPQMLQFQPDY